MPEDIVDAVVLDLCEHFADLDDDPDPVFGEWARVREGDGKLRILHQYQPWGVEITVRKILDDR